MATLNYTAAQIDALLAKADTSVQPATTGDLDNLATSTKTDLVSAINETFTNVSNGKSLIAAAITDKGVATAASDSFATMASNIALIPSGGGSSYTKIASVDYTINTTATTGYSIGTIALGSTYWTNDKILYIRVRDKAGARTNHFVGTDSFIYNTNKANGSTSDFSTILRACFAKNNNGTWYHNNSNYGIYPNSLSADGTLTMYARYNAYQTYTIDGTYNVTIYTLDYAPDQGNPFDYSFS